MFKIKMAQLDEDDYEGNIMKKILILANDSGVLYNFRYELLERLNNNGYDVYFSVPQSELDVKVEAIKKLGLKYIYVPINRRGMNPIEDCKIIINYFKIIKKIKPDLVLTYTIKPNIYGSYIAKKFNIPVIINITGMGTSLITSKFKRIMRIMYKTATKNAYKVFFQNTHNLSFFLENKMVNIDKAILIPGSGVNLNKFYPINKKEIYYKIKFLFIGRLMKEKGIDEYLKAAKEISEKYDNVKFQVLGSFEEEKYKEILNNKTIEYLGVSNDVREYIKEVDCIVNPSYHEGMSNVLLEGAAMGKPLIASNIPGCNEIIDDGINGFLFESMKANDLIQKIENFINLEEKDRVNMGNRSREKVEKEFDRNIVIDEYMKVISFILEDGEKYEFV